MNSTPFWRTHIREIVVGLLNVFLIGLGMGVPIFAILFGFPVGWQLGRRAAAELPSGSDAPRPALRSLALYGAALAGVTFLVLAAVWGPHLPKAFDPAVDATSFGIPLVLYTSQASKIAWFALMLVISPLAQFMAVVTAGVLAHAFGRRGGTAE